MTSSDTDTLLSSKNVTKRFGAMAAVDDLSFDVHRGEVLGIGGPNGAGKTTLFDVISGLTPFDEGKIHFDGRDVTHSSAIDICHLGLSRTFQLNAAFETMTVRENVLCAATFGPKSVLFPGLVFHRKTLRQADEIIEFVGLGDYEDEVVKDIPVLQKKLLMIASALATQPKLIMLDEPVGGLNLEEIDVIMKLVKQLHEHYSLTIVVIEHVMRFLVALSDRVIIMHHGSRIYDGLPGGLTKDRAVVEVYLGEGAAHRLENIIKEGARTGS